MRSDPVEPVAPVARGAPRVSWFNLALGVALAVAIGGVAFAVGRSTATVAFPGNLPGAAPGAGGFQRFGAGGSLSLRGTVQAIDADSLTLRTESGATIEVSLDGDTRYHQQTSASADDVRTGREVIVQLDVGVRAGGGVNPAASPGPAGPIGTAADVTVVP